MSTVAAVALHRFLWWLDAQTRWAWLSFSPDGARAVVGAITSSMLTFVVFTFSILLLAVQIAGSQLSPRIISLAMRNRFVKWALSVFVLTFTYSLCVLSRIEDGVPQLPMVVVCLSCYAKDTFVTTALYRMRENNRVDIPWLERQTGVQYQTLKKHYARWWPDEGARTCSSSPRTTRSCSKGGQIVPGQPFTGDNLKKA